MINTVPCVVIAIILLGVPRLEAQARPLLIVDDSGDMEGSDGFEPTLDGRWPMLTYLASAIGKPGCMKWSTFQASGTEGADQAPGCNGEFRVRPLTNTSPLSEVIEKAADSHPDRNLFFLTNGIDWLTEGSRSDYKAELDASEALGRWLRDPQHDLIVGIVRDMAGRHRPMTLIGLVQNGAADRGACSPVLRNIPTRFRMEFGRIENPQRILANNDVLRLAPHTLVVPVRGASSRPGIEPDGSVHIPPGLAVAIGKSETTLELQVEAAGGTSCGTGLLVHFSDNATSSATCTRAPNRATVSCVFELPQSVRQNIAAKKTVLLDVSTFAQNFLSMTGSPSFQTTMRGLKMTSAKRVRLLVSLRAASKISRLTIVSGR